MEYNKTITQGEAFKFRNLKKETETQTCESRPGTRTEAMVWVPGTGNQTLKTKLMTQTDGPNL